MTLPHRIEQAVGVKVERLDPLSGGCIADVYKADLADGHSVVVKLTSGGSLATEAYMLDYLSRHADIPLPEVIAAENDLLIMTHCEGGDSLTRPAQRHLADIAARLHAVTADLFGHERDTLIGPLPQRNTQSARWVDFFRDHRLAPMADLAVRAKTLSMGTRRSLDRLADRLDRYLTEPDRPRLLHGDLWTGNILCRKGVITALIDPAIYYGHPEVELAFMTLFNTVNSMFFHRYREQAVLEPDFFDARKDIYLLYPLLVHTKLFGGHYAAEVDRICKRFGG